MRVRCSYDAWVGVDLKVVARDGLKRVARGGGVATCSMRRFPEFLIIGAKRGGTTSLYFDLLEHPAVLRLYPPPVPKLKPEATKGVHYFDSTFYKGEAWYRSHFPSDLARRWLERRLGVPPVTGEASPYYLFHPAAAERAHRTTPESRIVLILRDPVMRTYSHWKERRRNNAEPLDFVSALDAEPDRLAGERARLLAEPTYSSYAWEQQSYATQSEYAGPLREWVDRYGRERVLVTLSEEYYADAERVLSQIHAFLGLTPHPSEKRQHRNAARGDDLDAGLRRRLAARFAEPNQALVDLIGRELPWE